MEKNGDGKISWPGAVILAAIILGGFYYVVENSKQKSIERQQQIKISEERRLQDEAREKEASEALSRSFCVDEAEQAAINQYKKTCAYDCKDGYYYIANYENYYSTCLQRKGLK